VVRTMRLALVGDYNPEVTAHQAIPKALALAANGLHITPEWLDTESALSADLDGYHGFWCAPASPYRSMDGALRAIRYARENQRPFLGTCGGCQHAVIEFARNVVKISAAGHRESDPETPEPVITNLACALIEADELLQAVPGTRLHAIYGTNEITETYRCSYGLNETYIARMEQAGLRVGVRGPAGEPRGVELTRHPFFFGTLYQPERSALAGERHPLISAFVAAVSSHSNSNASGVASPG
jgi:CTP synthase (UTP-ammonia lyase)